MTINSPGGSIRTNATRIAPTTSLTIAPTTSLTFYPGSPAQFNCSVNIANNLGVTGIITGNTISSAAATNLVLNSPGGSILTTATDVIASGALTLTSNGALNLQALTGNSSINISPSGSGVVNMSGALLVNTVIPYNSADLTLAASGTNGNVNLTATGSGSIKCNSSVIGSTVTENTITSPSATNLTINSPGGTINTNAVNFTAATGLTISSTSGPIVFWPFSICNFNANVTVKGTITAGTTTSNIPFIGSGLTTSTTNGNLSLTSNGTGYVNVTNTGLRLPNGATTLNSYEEATLTGTWSNTTTSVTGSLYIVRVGKQVTIQFVSSGNITPNDLLYPQFSATLPAKFCPISSVLSGSVFLIEVDTTGIISISNYTINQAIFPSFQFTYYSNAVTSSGASGQGASGSGDSGSGEAPNPPDKPVDNNPPPDNSNI